MNHEQNSLAYWFPLIRDAGLPVPETHIVPACEDLWTILDGKEPAGFRAMLSAITAAVATVGTPFFLRTDQTSGKHDWQQTCHVTDLSKLHLHVHALTEFSAMAGFLGLPVHHFVVRKLIDVAPLFHAFHGRMPVVREFRCFAEAGKLLCLHPYWPPDCFDDQNPSRPDWQRLVEEMNACDGADRVRVSKLACDVSRAVPGAWSVDCLQAADGSWWVTDMAVAGDSFHWHDCPNRKRWTGVATME